MQNIFSFFFKNRPLNLSELSLFTRNFSALLLAPSFQGAEAKSGKRDRVGPLIAAIFKEIESGKTLSQAFQKYEKLFGTFFCSIVEQGQSSGNPGTVFLKLFDYYEKRVAFHLQKTRLLKYPLIILLGATGCLVTLLSFFIPLGIQKTGTNPENVPVVAQAIILTAAFVQTHIVSVVLIFLITSILLLWVWRSNRLSPWLSTIAWKIPVFGDVIRKNSLQRFSLSLSTLLSCGINTTHALAISAGEIRNTKLEKRILCGLIEIGNNSGPILAAVKELSLFPPLMVDLAKNEASLDHTNEQLVKIAAFYQHEVEAALNASAILIGPVFVTITGLLGFSLLLSLYLPVSKVVGNP